MDTKDISLSPLAQVQMRDTDRHIFWGFANPFGSRLFAAKAFCACRAFDPAILAFTLTHDFGRTTTRHGTHFMLSFPETTLLLDARGFFSSTTQAMEPCARNGWHVCVKSTSIGDVVGVHIPLCLPGSQAVWAWRAHRLAKSFLPALEGLVEQKPPAIHA